MPNAPSVTAPPDTIDQRYRVEAELGRGGTAQVYRVLDQRSGRQLALKRLVSSGDGNRAVRAMFEREYHTLVQLAHPRIVRVFEYGLDGAVPYYTMELLEGADARETVRSAALGVRQVCLLLRDVASALSLIHSRRMVHRDISPRNLWCTADGRAKLLDFGTLVAMGPQTRIGGTAPFVPPEAVFMQPLDGRCDLYGLGALGYYLLTQRHAYPARHVSELREVWHSRPKRPDAQRPDLPPALAELIMALLSLDVRGRPASAAEVFERLTAIADLPAEDESHAARAFLTSPKLVGREDASAALRKRVMRAIRGRGGVASIVGAPGLGRSRLLSSLLLEAKLMGATTVTADASAVGTGTLALATALAERLLEVMPSALRPAGAQAAEIAAVLGQLSPELHRALGEPPLAPLPEFDAVQQQSTALVALFEIASRTQRLVIAVDDVHRSDGASLGVLARLSLFAGDHHLLLVTTCEAGTLGQPPPALEQLVQARSRVDIAPLQPEHTRELLASLFGAVPGLDEAASWLHELTQGSPQACMQYAQHLVDHGLARYEHGSWKLPQNLREHGLPPTLGAMFEARIAALSEDARLLALGLSLARDESRSAWQPEMHVRIEDFPNLLQDGDSGRAFCALDELLRAGILQQRDHYYVLAQRAIVDALLRVTDSATRRGAHARLGAVLRQGGYPALLAARQLQLAGEHVRAREILVAHAGAPTMTAGRWSEMRVSVQAECARTALAHLEAEGGTPRAGILLRRMLLLTCSVYDWSAASFGEPQLARLRADIGLNHWNETDPALPAQQRVIECMTRARAEHDARPEPERGFAPLEALRELMSCALTQIGACVNSHDVAGAHAVCDVLAQVRSLSPLTVLFCDLCAIALDRVEGRDLDDRLLAACDRLLASTEVAAVVRYGARGIYYHVQALEDARRGRERALELIDSTAQRVGDDMFFVTHGRFVAHAFRGQSALSERFRRQADVITEDDVWRRRAYLFVEAELHALTGDAAGLGRVALAIAELAEQFPGWRPWLAYCRGELHRLRGELDAAGRELSAALAGAAPGRHRAFVVAAPAHAELLLQRGEADAALREAEAISAAVQTHSLDRSARVAAERVAALAHAVLGDPRAAQACLERAFALARELGYDGLPLARLYTAQARIALSSGEGDRCGSALARLRGLLEHADAPALLNVYDALRAESLRKLNVRGQSIGVAELGNAPIEASPVFLQIRARLEALPDARERANEALELLLDETGAPAGHLFLLGERGAFAAASSEGSEVGNDLLAAVQQLLEAELRETTTAASTVPDAATAAAAPRSVLTVQGARFEPLSLWHRTDGRRVLTGAAVLGVPAAGMQVPPSDVLRAISTCLDAARDTMAVTTDG